ncbi:MAG: prephenate dehydrogenase/arogenate dehydrogenase family protein [Candidimonas sp.]
MAAKTTADSGTRNFPEKPVVAIVGVGLIGGSFAAALKAAGRVQRVLGVGRNRKSLLRAQTLGLIDEIATLEQAAEQADVILLATPVGTMLALLKQLAPHLRPGTLVTDAGSTKQNVVDAAREGLAGKAAQFIPAHPIAGAENTGPDAADPGLYRGRTVILTPLDENSPSSRSAITRVWEQCGARVISMAADAHDTILASVSHLPHFLSSVFMWQVASAADSDMRLTLAGSGFRDFTRIAAGSPEMWRDIFLANRSAVLAELDDVRACLDKARQALQDEDGQALYDILDKAALARRFWGGRSGLT